LDDKLSASPVKLEKIMYARFAEVSVKPGKLDDYFKTMREHVLPMLKTTPGFVDLTAMVSEQEPRVVLAFSVWRTKEDAQRYTRERFPILHDMVQPLIENEPNVRSFDVCVSMLYELQGL
jgi:quinol monooxygenase YgiN